MHYLAEFVEFNIHEHVGPVDPKLHKNAQRAYTRVSCPPGWYACLHMYLVRNMCTFFCAHFTPCTPNMADRWRACMQAAQCAMVL